MDTLTEMAPGEISIYSIDEAFMKLEGLKHDSLKPFAQTIKQRIWREQRIPCGVSIGPTQTLAKIGQCAAKEIPSLNGVAVLTQQQQWEWLTKRTPVEEVWGVGRRLAPQLRFMGVTTAYELSQMNLGYARKMAGLPLVRHIRELRGEPCIELETQPPSKQQIVCSRSFGTKLYELSKVQEAVSSFATRASLKLRKQGSYAGRMSVWLSSGQHIRESISDANSFNIPGGTSDARTLSRLATGIAARLFHPGNRYVKAGVCLMDIRPAESWQRDMFTQEEDERVMEVMDRVNRKYGRDTLKLAAQAGRGDFYLKHQFKSPNYLTDWASIPKIIC